MQVYIKISGNGLQQGLNCYNYNKQGHIARFYGGNNEKTIVLVKKIDINEEKEKMNITWVKKSDEKVEQKIKDGSTPICGTDFSSNN